MLKSWYRVAVIIVILIVLRMLLPTHVVRYVTWNFADVNDHEQFSYRVINNGNQGFTFTRSAEPVKINPGNYHGMKENFQDFDKLLEYYKTTSFLVIRNDSILYDFYADGYGESTIVPGFSIAKSFISALSGIAIDDGHFTGPDAIVGKYLPEIKDENLKNTSLQQLLSMQANLKFEERYYSPFGGMARFYYGTDLNGYIRNMKINAGGSKKYKYQSAAAQIAGMMIEQASGMTIDKYLEKKIWTQAGMNNNATWNTDSDEHGQIKCFCCFNATPLDFALFGRLYLNNGIYNGKKIIPALWVSKCRTINNDSRDSQGYPYTYFWRATENNEMFAKGVLGQYIYINFERDIIIIRTGKTSGDLDWIKIFREISEDSVLKSTTFLRHFYK